MSQVERLSECCRDEPFILPDICEMMYNFAELSAEMGEMSFYQHRWTSTDGDAIPHHYLFTASLLRSCLTLSYKGLMFKVIVCQKTFLLASNTNPSPGG